MRPPISFHRANRRAAQSKRSPILRSSPCRPNCLAMEEAQEITFDYLRVRKQFGKPIGSFQALQHQAVNIYIRTETTRSLLYQVATNNDPYRIDPALAASVKAKASEDAMFVTQSCISASRRHRLH